MTKNDSLQGTQTQLLKDIVLYAKKFPPLQNINSLLHCGYWVFKSAGAWRGPPTPPTAEVKGKVDLCLYPPLGLCCLLNSEFYLHLYLYRTKIL
jgi:hypothetical protein